MSKISKISLEKQTLVKELNMYKKKLRELIDRLNKMQESIIHPQNYRKDILINMLSNINKSGVEIFDLLLNENENKVNESRQGWIFETICQILISLKCIYGINYTEIYDGHLQNLKKMTDINTILEKKIAGGGNNIADMTIKEDTTLIAFTIKYKNKYCETDVSKLDNTISKQNITDNYKIGLIVKDKEIFIKHKYKNKLNIDKKIHDKIIENGLLFDEKDIIKGIDVFCERFSNEKLNNSEFIEMINSEYLLSPRQQLKKKLHQKMTELKFIESLNENKHRRWCIAHKPRSGKSITMLSISKYLLENGYKKILIMTSVPSTIDSFRDDLEKYVNFKNIKYCFQEKLNKLNKEFNGIVFSSVQYLKNGANKKDYLKNIDFDVIITDESHQGSSTNKTKTGILETDEKISDIFNDLCKKIKLNIFSSGTPDKTIKYYKIHESCVFQWELEDEGLMKSLNREIKQENIDIMNNRHGNIFQKCFEDDTLEKNYLKYPSQILMKHVIPQSLINNIKMYNETNGTNFGYTCSSLFALRQITNVNGEIEYTNEFELCKNNDGIEILKEFLEYIISNNEMKNTLMKQIEHIQTVNFSRKSTRINPLMFIIYLPTHTRNNTINQLQKTLIEFLDTYSLWKDYNIEYSSSKEDSGITKEKYNELIKSFMRKTKVEKKKGCILLLGDQGTVGVTYHNCDVTISLDDGHNIDNQKQRFSRALTESDNKTIGINVDMNVQRTYTCLNDIIQRYRKNTKTTKTNAEILYYLYEQKIFLFNPQEFNYGRTKEIEIKSFYQKESENIIKELDDSYFLDNIICDDEMKEIIQINNFEIKQKNINPDLNGENQDCPKGDKQKYEIDSPKHDNEDGNEDVEDVKDDNEDDLVNKTFELCRTLLFPLLSLISRSFNIFDYKDIFINNDTKKLILSSLDKKINLENYKYIVNIMNTIIDNNSDIVNNIREIYRTASADKLRCLIAKHFIPTKEEKKDNAEIPTPVELVDEMLDKMPIEFWTTPKKVFEPCCGKGNFVLGIFDKFFKGLEKMYPDTTERCNVIITKCIYYADLTSLNVFITTELLKCHIKKYSGLDNFKFNNYIGDTLNLNIQTYFSLNGFDAVIGNPPYNNSQNNIGKKGGGDLLWNKFVKKSLNEDLLPEGLLLYVHPSGWRKPESEKSKFNGLFKLMTYENQMIYLEIHDTKDGMKVFKCGTRYDWYIIKKIKSYKKTIIKSQNEIFETDLKKWEFLPNDQIDFIYKLLKKKEGCKVIYSASSYETRKKWVSKEKDKVHKYTLIHSTPKNGTRYMYSSINTNGHFGVPKIIFGDSGIYNSIIDINGDYGMTQHSIGIEVDNIEEATNIKNIIESEKFKKILDSCSWSNYQIDWRLFTYLKKDFWKEFM